MGEVPSEILNFELACNRDAPCVVRSALGSVDALEPIRDDARLIASELVTNVVTHSGCSPDATIAVTAQLKDDALVITVEDPGDAEGDAEKQDRPPGLGCFGLRIVEQVARAWGVNRPAGHRVWAEIGLPHHMVNSA